MGNRLGSVFRNRGLIIVSRLILGGVFIYAAIDKIAHPDQFAEIIRNYRILPVEVTNAAAIIMPWLELLAGAFLVLGIWARENAALLSMLLLVFIVAISYNLARGLDFDCGCFTTSGDNKSNAVSLLIRDVILLGMGLHVILFQRVRRRPDVILGADRPEIKYG
jgi:putative oxidoreductase